MEVTKTITFSDGATLNIIPDSDPESPRKWDNNGWMICFHMRYNLGDKHNYKHRDFSGWKALKAQIITDHDVIAILPLYLYDHSGLAVSTGDFSHCDSAGWDWGQVGFIVATRENLKKGGHDVDNLDPKEVEGWLRGEVATYNQFLTGDIYGFVLNAPPVTCPQCGHEEKGKELSACWGFYGDDPVTNGMSCHIQEKYRKELHGGSVGSVVLS